MDKKHLRYIGIAAFIVLGLWAATPIILFQVFCNATDRGTFGDLYGSVNALFSGLALLGVIAAIMLQHKELSLSTHELRNSAQALKKQVELAALTARIQALPTLIDAQKLRIETLGGRAYEGFSKQDYTIGTLESKISELRQTITTSPQEVEAIRKLWEIDPYDRNYFGLGTREQALDAALQSHQISIELNARLLQQFELLADYIKDLETLYQTIRQTSAQIE